MIIRNYQDFRQYSLINEDLDKSKKLLKDKYMLELAVKELDLLNPTISSQRKELAEQLKHKEINGIKLNDFTQEEQSLIYQKIRTLKIEPNKLKEIERDKEFNDIKKISYTEEIPDSKNPNIKKKKVYELGINNIGWLYMFTYFYYIENVSIPELENVYAFLMEYKGLLDKLPKKFNLNFIDTNIPNNFEKLLDGIEDIRKYKNLKKVYDSLTPILKKDYNDSPVLIKDKVSDIAQGFSTLGGSDMEKKTRLWKAFFGEERLITSDIYIHGQFYKSGERRYFGPLFRYKDIREFVRAAENFLKSCKNEGITEFYKRIEDCNKTFGTLGSDVVYDENGILVIDVKSFNANRILNGHTRHCIKDSQSTWSSYGLDDQNKQYYIYNFNLPNYDGLSTIGLTIEPNHNIRACHDKDDRSLTSNIKSILKQWENTYNLTVDIYRDYLIPMSKEEIKRREDSKKANREVIKPLISIEELKKLVQVDGADINTQNCQVLLNAVEENNLEKTKVALEMGANPNMRSGDAIINRAKTIDMIKLLVQYYSQLTGVVFENICHDLDCVTFCLNQGLDPNFGNYLPYRRCCRGSYLSESQPGESYFKVLMELIKYGATIPKDNDSFLRWAAEFGRLDIINYLYNQGVKKGYKSSQKWVANSRKLPDDMKTQTLELLKKYANEFGEK